VEINLNGGGNSPLIKKAIVYYTNNDLDECLFKAVQSQLLKAADGIPIISVSQKPIDFGTNICVGDKPANYRSLYEQILIGAKASEPESILYLCEHDVFYNKSHFEFVPPEPTHIYFNLNRYYWYRGIDMFGIPPGRRANSQCVGYRELFIENAIEHLDTIATVGYFMPGVYERKKIRNFTSTYANIDIRHDRNLTRPTQYELGNSTNGVWVAAGWGTPKEFSKTVGY